MSAIEGACRESTSVVELCRSVHQAVAQVVPTDRWCAFAVDPATLFATNGFHDEGVSSHVLPRLLELEHGSTDFNQLASLARSPSGVATLSDATGGDLAASARWRDVIVPSGLSHEMRAVFRDAGRVWGALVLLRGDGAPDFTAAETSFVGRASPTIASGFRRVLVRQHLDHGDDAREAGILMLSGEPLEIRTATSAARQWLDELDDGRLGDHLPTSVLSAAQAALSNSSGTVAVRTRTRAGRWLTITAEQTEGAGGVVGVIVQPSRPAEIAQIVGAAHGLTPRESDIVLLVAAGHTNAEIARLLTLSGYTVADHLKRVFAKLEVASRGELTSKLFYDYYLPRVSSGRPAGSDGWFLPD